MAEGFEEGTQENKSNGGAGGNMDAIAMVGAVIPKCDSSPHLGSNSISAITTSGHISSLGGSGSTTATAAVLKRDFVTESAKIPPSSPSPNSVHQQQQQQQQQTLNHHTNQSQPINLKSEVSRISDP